MPPRLIPLALAALVLLVFAPVIGNSFVEWDDAVNLLENPSYRGLGWPQLRWMVTTTLMGHYIPVTWLTFGIDYTLWGMNPLGYHLTNAVLHATSAALFYLVVLRLLAHAAGFGANALTLGGVTAALVFAAHPLRAESVAWATERRDVLSGLFFLLAVLFYLKAADEAGRRRRCLAVSLAAYVAALLSKSIVMTLPLVLLLLDVYPLRRLRFGTTLWTDPSARAVLRQKLPYVALGVAGAITSYWAVAVNEFVVPLAQHGWTERIAVAAHSVSFYVEKTIWPVALSPLYERPAAVSLLEPRFLWRTIAVVAVSLALVAFRRRWPAGLAVWIYYGLVLGPVSGLVQSGPQLVHDRYSYLSCLGWALLAGAAVGWLVQLAAAGTVRRAVVRAAGMAVAVWVLGLGLLTWQQVTVWKDSETLWRHAVESDPRCSICQGNLGSALYQRNLLPLAKERFELALAIRPDRLRPHGGLGIVLDAMGDTEAGMHHLRIAAASYPDDPDILTNMAVALVDAKRYPEALRYLERAERLRPNHVPSLVTRGNALLEMREPRQGLDYLLRARALRGDEPVLRYDLVRTYLALGDYEAAGREYDVLLGLDPSRARLLGPAFTSVW